MDERVVLVPANSKILNDPSTRKLHTYPNGSVLVSTSAPAEESREAQETPVQQGLQLHGVSDADLQNARGLLVGVDNQKRLLLLRDPLLPQQPISAYVELIGPIDPPWLKTLIALGVQPLSYQPENTYLCQGTLDAFLEASKQNFVLRITPLTDALKPKLETPGEVASDVVIVVQGTSEEEADLIKMLSAIHGVEVLPNQPVEQVGSLLCIRAKVDADGQAALLKNPRVRAVDRYREPVSEDEIAGLIIAGQYDANAIPGGSFLNWLENYGINGAGVTIGIVDEGVDVSHPAFSGRIVDLSGGNKSWHGTFVAGHAAGNYLEERDGNKFIYGLGTACAAELLVQDNSHTATALCKETVTQKGPSGVAGSVQNNSWGKGTSDPMDYRSDEYIYDQLVRNADPTGDTPRPLTICFSSGNSGKSGLTRPKAAKNVIITGNSENYRPEAGGTEGNNINQVYTGEHASSWGNCADQRIRPHVVAPGEWTSSANYDSHQGEVEYISPRLTWGGGSSGASPKTAGACALLIQWWRNHNAGKDPSPALLRALIVNGAEPMQTDTPAPNMQQGWGRLNIGNIVREDVRHIYVNQELMLTQPGEQKVWNISLADPSKPLKVTLAWTDPGGPLQSGTLQVDAIVNKLVLSVEAGGVRYLGGWRPDHFKNGWTITTGATDPARVDNLQNIFLPPNQATGTMRVTVKVLNITTNCLTGAIDTPQQDFALVITNGTLAAGSAPADVFVAVDQKAKSSPPPSTPDGFWKDAPGNSDTDLLHTDWWQNTQAAAKNEPAASSTPTDADTAREDDWWSNAPVQFSSPETERAADSKPLSENPRFVKELKAGMDMLAVSTQVRIISGSAAPVAEDERKNEHGQGINKSEVDLSQALADLMASWDSFGASVGSDPLMPRRVAILVVGAGTRVSREDLDAMRRLSFMGELYLIADDPGILSFLAQRIHRRSGLHFRLAAAHDELAQLVRDTLLEANSAQSIGVSKITQDSGGEMISKCAFTLLRADTHLTIRVAYPADAPLKEVKLARPGQNALLLNDLAAQGIRVQQQPDSLQIDIDASQADQSWAGRWVLELAQPQVSADRLVSVNVWAWGGPPLLLREQAPPESFINPDAPGTLVILSGGPDVMFQRSIIKPPRIVASQPVQREEAERDTVMAVRPSRLDNPSGHVTEAVREPKPTPILSQWLSLPRPRTGALVLDLPLQSFGIDAHGLPFARMTRANLIKLEPRSLWRARLSVQKKPLLITAQVVDVAYANGSVVGLRLRKGDRQRDVIVSSPILGKALAAMDPAILKGNNLRFGVSDTTLISVRILLECIPGGGKSPGRPPGAPCLLKRDRSR
jgi:hypothetical protein